MLDWKKHYKSSFGKVFQLTAGSDQLVEREIIGNFQVVLQGFAGTDKNRRPVVGN